jgi:hypothetical protein
MQLTASIIMCVVRKYMAHLEAHLAISKLLTELSERIKDGATAALVQEVQSKYQAIQASYFSAEQKAIERQKELDRIAKENGELHSKLREMEEAHAQGMAALKASHEKQVTELHSIIAELEVENAVMKSPHVGGIGPDPKAEKGTD